MCTKGGRKARTKRYHSISMFLNVIKKSYFEFSWETKFYDRGRSRNFVNSFFIKLHRITKSYDVARKADKVLNIPNNQKLKIPISKLKPPRINNELYKNRQHPRIDPFVLFAIKIFKIHFSTPKFNIQRCTSVTSRTVPFPEHSHRPF